MERSMKRTARIALATALLIEGGATLAMAQPPNPNYSYQALYSQVLFYRTAVGKSQTSARP